MCMWASPLARVNTAKRRMRVFKVLIKTYKSTYKSPYRACRYTRGKTKRVSIEHSIGELGCGALEPGSHVSLRIGLHAFTTKKTAQQLADSYRGGEVIEMYVPRYAKYIRGRNNEILCEALEWRK